MWTLWIRKGMMLRVYVAAHHSRNQTVQRRLKSLRTQLFHVKREDFAQPSLATSPRATPARHSDGHAKSLKASLTPHWNHCRSSQGSNGDFTFFNYFKWCLQTLAPFCFFLEDKREFGHRKVTAHQSGGKKNTPCSSQFIGKWWFSTKRS